LKKIEVCGNEDCGQMSAWFIFSSMGFYPVNPANGIFIFGSPLFDAITIKLPDNKQWGLCQTNNLEPDWNTDLYLLYIININQDFQLSL